MEPLPSPPRPRGRGAGTNPGSRFERLRVETDADSAEDAYLDRETGAPKAMRMETQFFRDDSQSVLSRNASPDLSFNLSVNPYRGCEHGCAYCYARPYHEYLGFSAGLDFESRIMVKADAPRLLREALSRPRYQPEKVAMSGVTDCYQPVERRLEITRRCLEVLRDFRNPVAVVTKNHLVTRDIDHLAALSGFDAAVVFLSVTTMDPKLARALEPRASPPRRRLEAIRTLAAAGIPTAVSVAPVIPGLNDHEVPAILEAAAAAGARFATYSLVRLPHGVKDLFSDWLETHAPQRRSKVLAAIEDVRGGGRLNDPDFGTRHTGTGAYANHIRALFHVAAKKHGLLGKRPELSIEHFRRITHGQPELF